ncbi:subtilisin-like extracellular serine protease [Arthrobacter crystallopoietes BAB-32]|uniref:Subtilisin-like extracellular serine protease n=1 Tax=Arthrobacter crystallopoietes BAB-32 TaxID=1246476 RepID=N1UZ75_9MICC|nr:subtilisin-like extracellular serine protease [Arthrobacter crystallopoietes BAB-32]
MRRRSFRAATALALGLPLILSSVAGPSAALALAAETQPPGVEIFKDGQYIVMLKGKPVATYDGGVAGIAATKPDKGKKVKTDSPEARQYAAHLGERQQQVAAEAGTSVGQSFTTAINGFTADLTAEQAGVLAKHPDVLSVSENVQHSPDYSSTEFLGLPGADGAWEQQYGGVDNAGKGVVVGVIDTGYYPDSAFFAGDEPVRLGPGETPEPGEPYLTNNGQIAMLKSDGETFIGECEKAQGSSNSTRAWTGEECNSKVLSARYFAEDFLRLVPPEQRDPRESISPLDINSHGTHTASTAAGNNGVAAAVDGREFGEGSGVAPEAKVSVYKICWEDTNPATGGCFSSASVAAIEQAVKDGVDVLNYSISGNNNSVLDPVALAFFNAAATGIFVSASAGNSGPAAETVNHSAPWLTTVAASTFSNELQGTVELSDGSKYRGASVMSSEVPQTDLVLSREAPVADDRDPATDEVENARLCLPASLDSTKTTGKIVVCERGVNPRVEKSQVVKDAGGVGMVLVNVPTGSLDLDLHAVPTVHIDDDGFLAKVAGNAELTAALVDQDTTGLPEIPLPQVAAFSSRGPSTAVGGDLLKPDIAAPGVGVLAGVSPVTGGENFGFLSGTSMAAPQVAGLAALLMAENPGWSPAAVKSAMMTTAADLQTADGGTDGDKFATGAGNVDAAAMADPGLVYDAGVTDWAGFLESASGGDVWPDIEPIEAKDVNVPSIALGTLTGSVTVSRTLTALEPGSYTASIDVPGVDAVVEPATLEFTEAGQALDFTVTFRNESADYGQAAMGELAWSGEDRTVTSPVAVRPVAALAPPAVTVDSAAGTGEQVLEVTSGTDDPIDITVEGMAKANVLTEEKTPDPNAVTTASAVIGTLTVPADTQTAQFAINAASEAADWDLYVKTPTGEQLTVATAASSESLTLTAPAAGKYQVIGHLYATSDGAATSTGTLVTAALGKAAGNLAVTPNPLELANGESGEVTAQWTGLEPGSWVGLVRFGDSAATALTVNVP